jgi:hypothetical protein
MAKPTSLPDAALNHAGEHLPPGLPPVTPTPPIHDVNLPDQALAVVQHVDLLGQAQAHLPDFFFL